MARVKQTEWMLQRILQEIYGDRYPTFDASRLLFSAGFWSYETSQGVVVRVEGVGLVRAASEKDCFAEIAKIDELLRRAYNLELGGPTGFMWVGWR